MIGFNYGDGQDLKSMMRVILILGFVKVEIFFSAKYSYITVNNILLQI